MTVKRGDVYMVELGKQEGSVQGGLRPVIIIQNDKGNMFSTTTMVCPLTSRNKKELPTHLTIKPEDSGIIKESTALIEQIRTVDKKQLIKKVGEIRSPEIIEKLNDRIKVCFGIQ